ncbi:WecB/TagA/CpsF family glycosyltransferase [Cohnella abietis]|uniref:N-acetylglucosaminyldiphosphoundecaprenol N-acetyl-beta-D-mannosaminyltransferase n=1 Tax=Cohnella abietis TaxID=2507935 RepID=A0A3T1DDM5_9BACL|nr:WecB/TagA/CpsF family glycosyltransferase [Cohnella abietis]BBI36192.1 acetylglucosaminyldiphosphoundecaprenol acetyl-beta-D-mannosaminyltransferase [Cohnella abietis]
MKSKTKPYPTVSLYGVPFSKMNMKETVGYLAQAIESRRPQRVITGNPIMLMVGLDNPSFHHTLSTADLVVPDGSGVVWAARRLKQPVQERVAGFDLMHELLREGDKRGWSVYMLGASPDIIKAAHDKLQKQFPGMRFVGHRDGYFTDKEDGEVVELVRAAKPDLLFVARSTMNQEPWIEKYQDQLGVPVVMGVGGSFDVVSGKLKRAPALFRKLGMEWFYRLLQEPTRFRRMLVLPRFALKVIKDGEKVLKHNNPS